MPYLHVNSLFGIVTKSGVETSITDVEEAYRQFEGKTSDGKYYYDTTLRWLNTVQIDVWPQVDLSRLVLRDKHDGTPQCEVLLSDFPTMSDLEPDYVYLWVPIFYIDYDTRQMWGDTSDDEDDLENEYEENAWYHDEDELPSPMNGVKLSASFSKGPSWL